MESRKIVFQRQGYQRTQSISGGGKEWQGMKTIKQIADELGVSKQKVYRFIVNNHITASSEVKQSKLYDEAAERLIKSHFNRITTSSERSGEPHQKSENEMLLEQLIKELEVKNEQLSEKDRQIKEKDRQLAEMQSQLSESQKLIDQEQQLRMVTEKKLLLLEEKEQEEQNVSKAKKWWQKIWK